MGASTHACLKYLKDKILSKALCNIQTYQQKEDRLTCLDSLKVNMESALA